MQWSTLAAPSSTASRTPGPWPSWLPCTRSSSPACASGDEHGPRLVLGEGVRRVRLAEDVDPPRVRSRCLQHRPRDQLEVCRAVARRTRAAPRGRRGRSSRGELAGDAQRPRLVLDGQAVAALDLDGRRALGAHLGDAGGDEGPQLVVGGGPGRGDGDPDAAAVVGRAGHPGGELVTAVAGEHQVRVGVDEAGQDRATTPRRPARSATGASDDEPTQHDPVRPPPRPPHRGRSPRPSGVVPSQVTSSPMPVTTVLLTGAPSRRTAPCRASAATSPSRWRPDSTTTLRRPTTTVSTSDRVAL